MVDSAGVEGRGPPLDPVHLVALGQQQLGQIGPVLAGDAGDQRTLAHAPALPSLGPCRVDPLQHRIVRSRRRGPPSARVRSRMRRSSASEACARTSRPARPSPAGPSSCPPWTCAQPVMPGRIEDRSAPPSGKQRELGGHQRARPDDRHVADQHVPELRQLVETGAAQQSAEPGRPVCVGQQPTLGVVGLAPWCGT